MSVRRSRGSRRRTDRGTTTTPKPSHIKTNTTRAQALKKVEKIFNESRYEVFIKKLGKAAKDPKIKAVLLGGLIDGRKTDDIVKNTTIIRMGKNLTPIQYQIDLESSLKWIGQHPENVPLILQGGTLDQTNFGGVPIVTSYGTYIVDGHHRWSQVYMINPEARLESINLQIEDPKAALRESQITIAALSGQVPTARIKLSKNIYTMTPTQIKQLIPRYLSPDFYEAFYKTYPRRYKTPADVEGHIYKNIMTMRRQSRPQTDIGRELMPQYSKIGVTRGTQALQRGRVNIKSPYSKPRKTRKQ